MKNKFLKLISVVICLCLLVTIIPVHAADVLPDNITQDDTTENDTMDGTTPDTDLPENPEDFDDSTAPEDPSNPEDTPGDEVLPEPEPFSIEGSMHKKRSVLLTWNSDDAEAVYNIYRSLDEETGFELIDSKSEVIDSVKYYDYTLTIGETYYYKVEKVKDDVILTTSNTASVKIRLLPVENVEVTITSANKVKLTWDKASYATSYIIYRSTSKDGEYTKIANPKTCEYTDKDVLTAKAYYYKIYSWKKDVASAKSIATDVIAAYTKVKKPVISMRYANKNVNITWDKVTRAEKYYIYRSTQNKTGTFKKIGETTNLKYIDKDTTAKKRYFYKVRGVYNKDDKNRLGYLCDAENIYTYYIDPDKKMVALTFDDGPGPYTDAIVDCLKKNNGRATFFVVGERIDTYSDELVYAFKNGNEIANHSYSHPNLTTLSKSKIKSEISKTDEKVKKLTGASTSVLRTPGGATNATVKDVCGKPIIFWSIDTLDWKHRNASKTVSTVMNNVKDGDIILMHDIHSPTKDAALELIPKLRNAGYQLVTVSELARYKGYTMENGTVYSSFR